MSAVNLQGLLRYCRTLNSKLGAFDHTILRLFHLTGLADESAELSTSTVTADTERPNVLVTTPM